jgi:DNA-binding beta-propeller fold protein YncE
VVLSSVRLEGAPTHLLLAPAPGGAGHRLYAVQQVPGPVRAGAADTYLVPRTWELVTLRPATLDVERTTPLAGEITALASAPDGDHVYGLAQPRIVSLGATTTALLHIDPVGGAVRPFASLPGIGLRLVVAGERVYVPNAFGAEVWAIDRRSGRLLQTIPVGRHPLAIAASGAQATAGSAN